VIPIPVPSRPPFTYDPDMTAGNRGAARSAGAPADLLPLVFARPKEALAGAQAVLAGRPSPADASIAHQVIGIVERDFGDAGAAVDHLRRAARLAGSSGSGDREGDVLATLGIALIHEGRTAAGLSTLATAVAKTSGLTAARVRFRRGSALWVLGRHAEALDEVRRALPVLRRHGDTIWIARALTLRALIALTQGATDRADRDLDTAERLFSTTDQEHDAAVAVHNRGIAALRAGDLPAALAFLDEAGRRYERLGTPSPELSLDRCAGLLAAGLAVDALAEADAAIRRLDALRGQATRRAELLVSAARAALATGDPQTAYQRATAASRAFAAQRRDWWSAHSRLLVLQSRLATGVHSERLAREAERTARRLVALGSDESTRAYLLAGRAALALDRPATAERHLALAARARYRGPALARTSGWLAEALRAETAGRTRRTLDACRRGLQVLDQHRLTLGASELRAQATAHGVDLVGTALRTCLREGGSARQLLVWCERWRATTLTVPPARPPGDRQLHAELARYREISSRLDAAAAAGAPVSALRQSLARAERGIRAFAMHAGGADAGAAINRPLEVAALLEELGDGQLLEIVEVDNQLHALLCGQGRVRRFPAGRMAEAVAETEHARSALLRLAHGAAARPAETAALLTAIGHRLERLLLGPAVGHLAERPLVIVPPGRLHGVPWALLPGLFTRAHEIAPSARAWLRARRAGPPPAHEVVLVRGPDLAAEADEVGLIAGLYDRPTVLRGADATTPKVLDALDGSALAHLAAHGTFRADSPLFSALRMADGPLTAYDFEQLRCAPHRLVLPCCDSARLGPAGSDELLGLAAALLPLGTVGIIGSVVPIDDDAAVQPMLALHRGLRRGLRMADALRDVRIGAADDPAALASAWSFVALGAG
jgi:tetratricopeptide (TPR) repeat protein